MSPKFNAAAILALVSNVAGALSRSNIRALLVPAFSMKAIVLLTLSANAGPCAQDIDRAWNQVGAKIQARIGAGRSAPQGAIALLHRQPTPHSIAVAEEKLGEVWKPMEMAVAALGRAREAEHANDAAGCEQAIFEAQWAIRP